MTKNNFKTWFEKWEVQEDFIIYGEGGSKITPKTQHQWVESAPCGKIWLQKHLCKL